MPEPTKRLQVVVDFYREYKDCLELEGGTALVGFMPLGWDADRYIEIFKSDDVGVFEYYDLPTRKLRINTPSGSDGQFAASFEDFLTKRIHLHSIPEAFYIVDPEYYHGANESNTPDVIDKYKTMIWFIECLLNISDHEYNEPNGFKKLVFFQGESVDLCVQYEKGDIVELGLPEKACLNEYFNQSPHMDQKRSIIKKALIKALTKVPNSERFRYLLKNIAAILENIKADYQIFINDFSFDKIKDNIERDKLDFILKLNKTLSDIQNQLLAIPLGFLIAGAQITPGAGCTPKNLMVLLGMAMFAILMWVLTKNQKSNSDAILKEITLQKNKVEASHPEIKERIGKSYDDLLVREKSLESNLLIVRCIIVFCLLATIIFIFDYKQAWENLISYCF